MWEKKEGKSTPTPRNTDFPNLVSRATHARRHRQATSEEGSSGIENKETEIKTARGSAVYRTETE